jgi:hypothetical protein
MKKLLAIAGFLLVSTLLAGTAAQAQYTFEYGGRTIRIDPDRGTVSIPGVYDNTGRRKHVRKDDSDRSRKPVPQQATVDPQAPAPAPAPAPTDQAAAPAAPLPANAVPSNAVPDASAPAAATANAAPADVPAAAPPPPAVPAPVQQQAVAAPTARPAPPPPPPANATAPPPQKPATTVATAQPQPLSPNSPLGLWLTEEKEGKVRIEQCGQNLCGYSVDAKSNQNGEQVLINMKPGKDAKWTGRIFDPNTGSTYDSTIALKSPDSLRVQGCAFGGMFCGGQTWSRVN